MEPSLHLLVNNVLSVVSIILLIGISLFTYLNGRRQTANITFALLMLAGVIFFLSHVVGINISNAEASRVVLMMNMILFLCAALQVHATLALVNKINERRPVIIFFYMMSAFLILFFAMSPDSFLLPSVQKMYFPNYYNPGILNWLRLIPLFCLAIPYSIFELTIAYKKSDVAIERKRYLYFILTVISAYAICFIPNFLVYDIQIDPLWGTLAAPIFAIPFLYGAIQYELFNIRVIAKQAFFFSLAVVGTGGLIMFFNFSNNFIAAMYPNYPTWITILTSSLLVVTVGVLVWHYMRESAILKYEFLTTVTHKFRTPLTHIKWASENLSKAELSPSLREQVNYIEGANAKLVELTDLLVQASGDDSDSYGFKPKIISISQLNAEVIASLTDQIKSKNLSITEHLLPDANVFADISRIKFVIQVLLENAISYTPDSGKISITTSTKDNHIIYSVKDTGIGMAKEEIPLLFSRFYRGKSARSVDTEGMGIGLFIARNIIVRQGGKFSAESDGPGKGSTFSFSLPEVKA